MALYSNNGSVDRFLYVILITLFILSLSGAVHAQRVNFDFEDAELRTVIQAVAEFTGKNFLVDPQVKGKVTVIAPDPLTEEEAYKAFQSALEVNGYITVEADGVIKIIPAEKGRTQKGDVAAEPNRDDMVTRVIALEYVLAESLVPVLRPLIPPYAHLAADAKSSSLILTDRAANVERLLGIIKNLDRPAKTGEVELLALNNASSEGIATLLNRLYETSGEKSASSRIVVMADPRTNSLLIKADVGTRKELMALASELDKSMDNAGNTHVVYLKNASAENVAEVLQETIKDSDGETVKLPGRPIITADNDTNSLVITASKSQLRTLEQVIKHLDVRRLQVYVEALIAEVSTDSAHELGIQWQTADGLRSDNRGIIGRTDFNTGTSITDAIINPLAAGAGLSLGYIDGTFTLPDGTEVVNLSVLARALDSQSDANVLSTPNILTMDNEEAEIVVGQNVPFVTGSFSQINQGTAVANPFQTIVREDVGLTLRIKPQITEGSAIKMDIFQEVSSVAQRGEAQDIVTNTRSLTTTVVAENDRMLVLGGLIQDDISVNNQKVPLLGDIPLLGKLFSYKNTVRRKTNLLVFLRPRIIRGLTDMDEPTREKYDYLGFMTDQQELRQAEQEDDVFSDWELISPPVEKTQSDVVDHSSEAPQI